MDQSKCDQLQIKEIPWINAFKVFQINCHIQNVEFGNIYLLFEIKNLNSIRPLKKLDGVNGKVFSEKFLVTELSMKPCNKASSNENLV